MTPKLIHRDRVLKLFTYALICGLIGGVNSATERPLHAQEGDLSTTGTWAINSENPGLTREQAETALAELKEKIASARDKVAKLHREPAASDATVAQAERELQVDEKNLVVY